VSGRRGVVVEVEAGCVLLVVGRLLAPALVCPASPEEARILAAMLSDAADRAEAQAKARAEHRDLVELAAAQAAQPAT
jgi:hypothetical protein